MRREARRERGLVTVPAIAAHGLVKRFGRSAVLAGIDFELARGETLAVLGANGAGKSTLLRLAAGLARPSEGTIQIAGQPATLPASRARVGYVGHATQIYPALTARENLRFAARLHNLPDADDRIENRLALEGLARVADRVAGDFSRGMAQRLAIARGLLHDPELVLLDEPFTGLDRASAERLTGRMQSLRNEGATLLWVTHAPGRAAAASHAILMLHRGQIATTERAPFDVDRLEQRLRDGEAE